MWGRKQICTCMSQKAHIDIALIAPVWGAISAWSLHEVEPNPNPHIVLLSSFPVFE